LTGFESNLLAEGIGILVGLAATYLIVERLLKRQEARRWIAAEQWMKDNMKGKNQVTLLIWGFQAKPTLVADYSQLSPDDHEKIAAALKEEIAELKTKLPNPRPARPSTYWLDVARGLGSSDDFVEQFVNRAELALRDRPDLTRLALELEDTHRVIKAFRDDDTTFGQGKIAQPLPALIFRALRLHSELADMLA